MKKQYIKPTTTMVGVLSNAILAGSGPGTDSNYSSTYGNSGQQGGENTDEIKSTDGYEDSDFTQGSKQNIWNGWDWED